MAGTKLDCLIRSADAVVGKHAGIRTNGKVASIRTQKYSLEFVRETCRRLHNLGFYLEDIEGLKEKHIEAVVRDWYKQGLSTKTMQNQMSRLRIFCGWLGRPGLVARKGVGVSGYLPEIAPERLRVSTITQDSKSWSGNGIDVVQKIQEARREDSRFGAMLLMGLGFGLRKKEQLRIKPWKSDKVAGLDVDGNIAKGGRKRTVTIETGDYGKLQRWCLDEAKKECRKYDALGWPGLSYKQSENRYYHLAQKLGFTKEVMGVCMHGLRAEYAENMAIVRGLLPPSLGGAPDQMPKVEREVITTTISNLLGHNELHTIGAYFSSFRLIPQKDGIGERIGSVLVDGDTDTFGSIHCNPPVVPSKDGSYRHKSESERAQAVITVSIEQLGRRQASIGLAQFMQEHPELTEKVLGLLHSVGLGDIRSKSPTPHKSHCPARSTDAG